MPSFIAPMLASLAERPPRGDGWLYEIKWDGIRAICLIDNGQVRLASRNANYCEKQYPELTVLPHHIAAERAILDGEIAVLDDKGVPQFGLIQPRIGNSDPNSVAHMARSRPVTLFLFDVMYLDGYDVRQVPLVERKKLLESILTPGPVVRLSEHFAGAGEELMAAAREQGLEGILAKRLNSCYESRRCRDWVKVKIVSRQEFLICGFTAGEREYFGSLALGLYEDGQLVYTGNVGTGFDMKNIAQIHARLEPLITPRSPFSEVPKIARKVTWVRPELVCEIKFAAWTEDRRLRAPVFLGLRPDVDPRDCRRENAARESEQERPRRGGRLSGRGPLLEGKAEEAGLEVDGHYLKFTNLNKVFYPEEGYTKRDVINYYDSVAELILPYLKDRPLSLKRYPNGIHEDYFFQKDVKENLASWLRTEPILHTETSEAPTRYALAEDRASLLYLANLACIDQNPWMSRVGSLDHPDFVLIDLDPQECPFEMIVEAALLVHDKLERIGVRGYPKTTGGDGLHIYIPVEPVHSYEEVKSFAEVLAHIVIAERPDLFTTPRAVSKRVKNKVYFDYLQNGKGKTIAAPYVLRAYDGAPVATPLAWEEVRPGLSPRQFHIRNARARFEKVGDLFAPVLSDLQRLADSLERMEQLVRSAGRV